METDGHDVAKPTRSEGDRYDPLHWPALGQGTPDYSIPGDVILMEVGSDGVERIRLRTRRPRVEWVPRKLSDQDRGDGRAPVTIQYRGRFYEVVDRQDSGRVTEYSLAPWPEGEVLRRVVTLSRQAVLEEIRTQDELRKYRLWERWLRILYPLIGLLPGEAQSTIAGRLPIDLYRCMTWSCLAEVALGVYLLFLGGLLGTLQGLTGNDGSFLPRTILLIPAEVWVGVSPYFVVEGLLRWRHTHRGGLFGFLPFEVLWRLFP